MNIFILQDAESFFACVSSSKDLRRYYFATDSKGRNSALKLPDKIWRGPYRNREAEPPASEGCKRWERPAARKGGESRNAAARGTSRAGSAKPPYPNYHKKLSYCSSSLRPYTDTRAAVTTPLAADAICPISFVEMAIARTITEDATLTALSMSCSLLSALSAACVASEISFTA
jgi:hypothetical protein